MAEEKKEEHHSNTGMELMLLVVGLIVVGVLWYNNGGLSKIDKRGIFISPPAPLGNGAAYGPHGETQPQKQYGQVNYQNISTSTPITNLQ